MTRVVATQEGDWVVAKVEGPRSLRTALRQSIPAPQIEHAPDAQVWRIHQGAWPTACTVFSRFEVPIVWAGLPDVGVPHASIGLPVSPVSDADPEAQHSGLGPPLAAGPSVEAPRPPPSLPVSPIPDPSSAHPWVATQPGAIGDHGAAAEAPARVDPPREAEELPPTGQQMSAVAEAILQAMAPVPTRSTEAVLSDAPAPSAPTFTSPEPRAETTSYQSEEYDVQDGLKEFTITISGNGLTVERSIDHQTAWAILARLFGPDAAPTDGRVAAGTFR